MADNSLSGRTCVLTGGGGGIGQALAVRLAQAGMNIVLLGGNRVEKLQVTAKLTEKYAKCRVIPGDLTDWDLLDAAVKTAAEAFGTIDVLINNAGTAQNTPFAEITAQEYDKIMNLNCRVPFLLCQKFLPYLEKSSVPAIVNIASVVAHSGYPFQSVYSASKHALLGFTKSLAREYYQKGIRVHAVSPGGVYTDMVKVSRPDLSSEGMILPEDVAEAVYFLLSSRTCAVIDEIQLHRCGKEPFTV